MRATSAFPRFVSRLLALPFLLAACTDPQGLTQAGRARCWQNAAAFNISCAEIAPAGPTAAPASTQGTLGPVLAPHPSAPIFPVTLSSTVARSASADNGQTAASQTTATEAAAAAAGTFGANAAYATPTEAAASSADGHGRTSVSYTVNGKGYAVSVGENGPTITEIN